MIAGLVILSLLVLWTMICGVKRLLHRYSDRAEQQLLGQWSVDLRVGDDERRSSSIVLRRDGAGAEVGDTQIETFGYMILPLHVRFSRNGNSHYLCIVERSANRIVLAGKVKGKRMVATLTKA